MRDVGHGETETERSGSDGGPTLTDVVRPEIGSGVNVETAFARARLQAIQARARTHVIEASEHAYAHPAPEAGEPDREIALWNKAGHYAGVALIWALFVTPVVAVAAILLT
jgi:hypothetical protein